MLNPFDSEHFMRKAYQQALKAYDDGEVPVGAVVVHNQKIIGTGYNQVERLKDVSAHAEMIAITAATQFMGSKYLTDCSIYVSLEPCAMCAGLIHWSQISKVFYGASDPKKGFSKYSPALLLPKVEIEKGIMENDCSTLVKTFFEERRK